MPLTTKRLAALMLFAALQANAQTPVPSGEIAGTAWTHTADSLAQVVQQADVFLPARATGAGDFFGKFRDAPATTGAKVAVVVFLHGSSGLGSAAIADFQRWLGSLGIASVAPNSFALPGRVTYKSPIDKPAYERIHALRLSEIEPAVQALAAQPWADRNRLILIGTSEGSVPVARYTGGEFAARVIYAWSCESNYFVESPRSAFSDGKPVLNIISASDPFFSKSNTWLGNPAAAGHCGAALKGHPNAAVLLIPDAPHTLFNLPAARHATAGFLQQVTRP
jgi:hypothetical protein